MVIQYQPEDEYKEPELSCLGAGVVPGVKIGFTPDELNLTTEQAEKLLRGFFNEGNVNGTRYDPTPKEPRVETVKGDVINMNGEYVRVAPHTPELRQLMNQITAIWPDAKVNLSVGISVRNLPPTDLQAHGLTSNMLKSMKNALGYEPDNESYRFKYDGSLDRRIRFNQDESGDALQAYASVEILTANTPEDDY